MNNGTAATTPAALSPVRPRDATGSKTKVKTQRFKKNDLIHLFRGLASMLKAQINTALAANGLSAAAITGTVGDTAASTSTSGFPLHGPECGNSELMPRIRVLAWVHPIPGIATAPTE